MIEKLVMLDFDEPGMQTTPIILNQANINSVVFNYRIYHGSNEIKYSNYARAEVVFVKRDGLPVIEDAALSAAGISYVLNDHIFDIADYVIGYVNLYTSNTLSATLQYRFKIISDRLNIARISEVIIGPVNKAIAELLALIAQLKQQSNDEYASFLLFLSGLRNLSQSDYNSLKSFFDGLRASGQSDYNSLKAFLDGLKASGQSDYALLKAFFDGLRVLAQSDYNSLKAFFDSLRVLAQSDYDELNAFFDNLKLISQSDYDAFKAFLESLKALSRLDYNELKAFLESLKELSLSDYDAFKKFLEDLKTRTELDLEVLFLLISEQVREFKENTTDDFLAWWDTLKDELSDIDVADLIVRMIDLEKQKVDDALEEFPYLIEHNLPYLPYVFAVRSKYGYGYAPYGGVTISEAGYGEGGYGTSGYGGYNPVESGKYGGTHISVFIRFEWVSENKIKVFLPERLRNVSLTKANDRQFVINSDSGSYNIFLR